MAQIKVSVGNGAFISVLKTLNDGDVWENGAESYNVTVVSKPTNFKWHQRIFPKGIILHKIGTQVRIFIEEEKYK